MHYAYGAKNIFVVLMKVLAKNYEHECNHWTHFSIDDLFDCLSRSYYIQMNS